MLTNSVPAHTFNISYTAHGLGSGAYPRQLSPVVPITRTSSGYALSKADSAANVEMIGVATVAPSADTLVIQQTGVITRDAHGYTGPVVMISPLTAGGLTETAPTLAGHFIRTALRVLDANTLEVVDYPAMQVVSPGSYSVQFTNASLTAGVLNVVHQLGQRALHWTLMDDSGLPATPTGLVFTDAVSLSLDLSSYGTITGTWTLLLSKGGFGAGAGGGGMWELVSRQTVTGSGVRSIDFTGLSGNADGRYRLRFYIVNGYNGSNQIKLYTGSGSFDQTDGNYTAHYLYGLTSAYSGNESVPDIGNIGAASTNASGDFEIIATTGYNRSWMGMTTFHSATATPDMSTLSGMWKDSVSNIDRIQVYSAASATGIGVNSWAELWKLSSGAASGSSAAPAPCAVFNDTKAANTAGGTFTAGAWRTRDLNTTQYNGITGCSLASNQITLPAGVYRINASAPAYFVNHHKAALKNITDGVFGIIGTVEYNSIASNWGSVTRSVVSGVVSIASPKVFEVQHYAETTYATAGFGLAFNVGSSEVYTTITIEKLS